MSTITAILESDADGTLRLPLPAAWRRRQVKVVAQVDLLPDATQAATDADPSTQLFDIMERIAQRNPFKGIKDPMEWQREMREDVILPWPTGD